MAQGYVTTYRNHYRWQDPEITPSCKPVEDFSETLPPESIWIGTKVTDDGLDDKLLEKFLESLQRRNRKRMISTYKMSYCKDMFAKLLRDSASSLFENQLLKYARNLYEPDSRPKICPPLLGNRKTFGYIRPTRNYTPLTSYQRVIGLNGYHILKGDVKKVAEKNDETEANDEGGVAEQKIKKGAVGPTHDCACGGKNMKK